MIVTITERNITDTRSDSQKWKMNVLEKTEFAVSEDARRENMRMCNQIRFTKVNQNGPGSVPQQNILVL